MTGNYAQRREGDAGRAAGVAQEARYAIAAGDDERACAALAELRTLAAPYLTSSWATFLRALRIDPSRARELLAVVSK